VGNVTLPYRHPTLHLARGRAAPFTGINPDLEEQQKR